MKKEFQKAVNARVKSVLVYSAIFIAGLIALLLGHVFVYYFVGIDCAATLSGC